METMLLLLRAGCPSPKDSPASRELRDSSDLYIILDIATHDPSGAGCRIR